MKRTLTALTIAATMFASNASAFDPDDLQKLKDTNTCWECDLSGADLSGADLSGANLSEAILRYTYMNGAILCNTTMPDGSVIYSGC
ncbi:pentapeptide repeat-containing protein [bacterium]|nr:pentapeptide repeat-containing protein [bacterium]